MQTKLSRYWINQPSKHQMAHDMDGKLVIAPRNLDSISGEFVDVYFASGDIISARINKSALSAGWPKR